MSELSSWPLEDDQSLSEEEVSEVKSKVRSMDDLKEIDARNIQKGTKTEMRNIIMVGRTRSGKSTAISVLKDTCYKPPSFNIFSETARPKFSSFVLTESRQNYIINVIDTPGLFEQKGEESKARDNDIIMSTILESVKHKVTSVNSLMIFASCEAGIRPDDIQALEHFLRLFGGAEVNLALCITRSESRNEKNKEELVAQLRLHPTLGPIIKEKNIEILFMGCIDYVSNYTDKKTLMRAYKPVYDMREKALQWIFSSKSKSSLSDLPVLRRTQ